MLTVAPSVYGTNEPSDDTPGCEFPHSEKPCESKSSDLPKHATDPVHPTTVTPLAIHQDPDPETVISVSACLASIISPGLVPASPGLTSTRSGLAPVSDLAPSPGLAPTSTSALESTDSARAKPSMKTTTAPLTPPRRTSTQHLRDVAFGTSDDELSEVEWLPEPPKKPEKKRSLDKEPSMIMNAASNFNFDEEITVSSPTRPPKPRPRPYGKKTVVISDDEIEDIIPASKFSDTSISRRRSTLRMSPLRTSRLQARLVPKLPPLKTKDQSKTPRTLKSASPGPPQHTKNNKSKEPKAAILSEPGPPEEDVPRTESAIYVDVETAEAPHDAQKRDSGGPYTTSGG